MVGDPYTVGCQKAVECQINDDCPKSAKCIHENGIPKCRDVLVKITSALVVVEKAMKEIQHEAANQLKFPVIQTMIATRIHIVVVAFVSQHAFHHQNVNHLKHVQMVNALTYANMSQIPVE